MSFETNYNHKSFEYVRYLELENKQLKEDGSLWQKLLTQTTNQLNAVLEENRSLKKRVSILERVESQLLEAKKQIEFLTRQNQELEKEVKALNLSIQLRSSFSRSGSSSLSSSSDGELLPYFLVHSSGN